MDLGQIPPVRFYRYHLRTYTFHVERCQILSPITLGLVRSPFGADTLSQITHKIAPIRRKLHLNPFRWAPHTNNMRGYFFGHRFISTLTSYPRPAKPLQILNLRFARHSLSNVFRFGFSQPRLSGIAVAKVRLFSLPTNFS